MVKKVSIQSTKDLELRYRMMRQTIECKTVHDSSIAKPFVIEIRNPA